MPANTKQLKGDVDKKPSPQYFDPVLDEYEYLYGSNGAARHTLYGPDGQPITTDGNKLAVRATEIETQLTAIQGYVDGLEGAIGQAVADPAVNTLLARLKSLEDKIDILDGVLDSIVDGSAPAVTQLSGSNIPNAQAIPSRQQNKVEISTILNAVSVPVFNADDLIGTTVIAIYAPDGASEIYLAVNIDKQPWSVAVESWTGYSGFEGQRLYPVLKNIPEVFTSPHVYKLALIYGESNPIEPIDSYEKALRAAYYPIGGNMSIRIWNKHATDTATVTVKMIKVWRNR